MEINYYDPQRIFVCERRKTTKALRIADLRVYMRTLWDVETLVVGYVLTGGLQNGTDVLVETTFARACN
jgi:hypothetical protein